MGGKIDDPSNEAGATMLRHLPTAVVLLLAARSSRSPALAPRTKVLFDLLRRVRLGAGDVAETADTASAER